MEASFGEDRDIAAEPVLDAILAELGLDGPATRAEAALPERAGALRATEEAMARGVFGAPTFFAGNEMFWG